MAKPRGPDPLAAFESETAGPQALAELRAENDRLRRALSRGKFRTEELHATQRRLAEVERELELALSLPPTVDTFTIKPTAATKTGEAIAFLVGSDHHIEEHVDPKAVNGLNRYNLDESKRRCTLFFERGLRLVRLHQSAIHIGTWVIPILGDMISNSIHEDLAESNLLPPTDAAERSAEYLCSGFELLLAETQKEGMQFYVPMHTGNHGRMTRERRVQTEAGNSLERLIYAIVVKHFRTEPRITFNVARSYHTYVKAYDWTVRLHHGHAIRYQGGIGGLTIPAYRKIADWNRGKPADLDIFGHHHTLLDGDSFISNGSMIGYNAFAVQGGYKFQRPMQAWFLIDKKRGKRALDPIFFD